MSLQQVLEQMGNPISYNSWSYTWARGRQLVHMADGFATVSYKYNADGLRIEKRASTIISAETVTKYTLHGKNIVHLTQDNHNMHFFYDAQNRPAIVEWNNGITTAKYAFIYNLQGDVIALVDSTGTEVVKYVYDAWGKVLSATGTLASTLGTIQPFRYRGYVYDVETGLYYLCSRYYDPDWGRFLNADSIVQNHLFSYCENNPVIFVDHYGMRSSEIDFSPLVEFLKQRKRLRDLDNFTIGELIINDTVALREHPYIDSGWRFEIDRDYATDIYVNKRIFFEGEDVPADAINHDSSRIWFEVVLVKKPGIGSSDTPINCFISAGTVKYYAQICQQALGLKPVKQ